LGPEPSSGVEQRARAPAGFGPAGSGAVGSGLTPRGGEGGGASGGGERPRDGDRRRDTALAAAAPFSCAAAGRGAGRGGASSLHHRAGAVRPAARGGGVVDLAARFPRLPPGVAREPRGGARGPGLRRSRQQAAVSSCRPGLSPPSGTPLSVGAQGPAGSDVVAPRCRALRRCFRPSAGGSSEWAVVRRFW